MHINTHHLYTCTHAHTQECCNHACDSWIYHKCYQCGSLLNLSSWTRTWFHVSSSDNDGSLLAIPPCINTFLPPPSPSIPTTQGCSCCCVLKPECISVISAGLYVGLGTPQADLGWVELGEPSGLVDLHQTGHPRPPDGRL